MGDKSLGHPSKGFWSTSRCNYLTVVFVVMLVTIVNLSNCAPQGLWWIERPDLFGFAPEPKPDPKSQQEQTGRQGQQTLPKPRRQTNPNAQPRKNQKGSNQGHNFGGPGNLRGPGDFGGSGNPGNFYGFGLPYPYNNPSGPFNNRNVDPGNEDASNDDEGQEVLNEPQGFGFPRNPGNFRNPVNNFPPWFGGYNPWDPQGKI